MAQSLVKQLARTEIIEVEDDENSSIHFRFPDAPRSGQLVVEGKHDQQNLRREKKTILKDINFQVEKGNRIAFVGRNGEGKTTLAKIIVGDTQTLMLNGIIHLAGHNVKVGYYAQSNKPKNLNGEHTVFQTVDHIATGEIRTRL